MELWMDLLFGNWTGILSLITVFGAFATVAFILSMLYRKSYEK
jgi:hypothetical protein